MGGGGAMLQILRSLNNKNITTNEVLSLSFRNRDKNILSLSNWFIVKVMYRFFNKDQISEARVLNQVKDDLQWSKRMMIKIEGEGNSERLLSLLTEMIAALNGYSGLGD